MRFDRGLDSFRLRHAFEEWIAVSGQKDWNKSWTFYDRELFSLSCFIKNSSQHFLLSKGIYSYILTTFRWTLSKDKFLFQQRIRLCLSMCMLNDPLSRDYHFTTCDLHYMICIMFIFAIHQTRAVLHTRFPANCLVSSLFFFFVPVFSMQIFQVSFHFQVQYVIIIMELL